MAKLMRVIGTGDVLVVARLHRLARSVSHLLAVIEDLEDRRARFRSLRYPIDTSTPQGILSLQTGKASCKEQPSSEPVQIGVATGIYY